MNLLKFVKVLFLKVLQLHRGLGDVVYNARNVCEPQFVTGHIARDEKSCDVTFFRQPRPHRRFAEPLKTIATLIMPFFNNARFEQGSLCR